MFDLDRWQEIFETIRKNKLRTFLTGVSVASGIFILVILLGFGNGMENGIRREFERDATNRIWLWTGITSKEYKGLNPGRRIQLTNENFNHVSRTMGDQIEYSTPLVRLWGTSLTYGNESSSYGIQGVNADFQKIENVSMVMGRYIDQKDIHSFNKVVVVSETIRRELMGKVENPLGTYLQLGGINFQIIGIYIDAGGEREENRVYIPASTMQRVFNKPNQVDNMTFTLPPQESLEASVAASNAFTEELMSYLKSAQKVAPDDTSAIQVYNAIEDAERFWGLMTGIATFFWFVGIFTIIAGVVGVSNIMLIVVKERTREIGVRKALGARPRDVIWMILQESIFVTAVAGFFGFILSMGLLEIVGPNVKVDYVVNPSVNFETAITMVFVLIIAGTLAGFFPAWKAAHVQPIVALRDE